ncbi:3'-5' exonuclease [Pedobacter chitinilyticus]|uniref:3'-5' exonuclease n=1 Tax=Pedobacter chitinilyticus TaxID=2233776 RepID=A0A443YM28_9SPHI|nr:3'-5' exonuclease [Pedobacter chitinilyticus]RWU04801.1 3'-5' exonuclease [Pedobacter chitinilyticus]
MLEHIKLNNIFLIDIETVPLYENFDEMPAHFQVLWDQKSQYQRPAGQTAAEFYERAGIWAEFGKIICISIGFFHLEKKHIHLRIRSLAAHDEKLLLLQFIELLNNQSNNLQLCAHNGKEFDFPYLCRRMLINGLKIPKVLQLSGKKPWEINHLDTLELWKFGDHKHFTSLNLLAAIFDLPTPKGDLDGSKVREVYYQQKDLNRIARYCENDVITLAQVLLRLKGLPIIPPENITLVE